MDLYLEHDINGTLTTQPNFTINVTILTFQSSTITFSTVTSRHHLHMAFTCCSWFDIREPVNKETSQSRFHRN